MKINYRVDINLSKKLAFDMVLKHKHTVVKSKKNYSKKDRLKNKIKKFEDFLY